MRALLFTWSVVLLLLVACESTSPVVAPPAKLDWVSTDTGGALPPRLTGADGEGLALVSLQAQVVVQAPLAFTELHMRFHNPESRVREGNFEITLPPTAALSRFAMRIGERFQEGEVVERKAAQRAYEDFLHRRQDPAMLEHDAGNRFRARVFPIGPNEDKEIILSYSEELDANQDAYRLRLAGLPTLASLKVRVLASDGEHRIEQKDAPPRGDIVLKGGRATLPDLAMRAGDLYLARVTPKLDATRAKIDALTVLFDTSASGALGFDARAERVLRLIEQLSKEAKRDFEVRLVAFDQVTKPLFAGPASKLVREGLPALQKRRPLGASNLEGALAALSEGKLSERLLLVSDAVFTVGELSSTKLAQAVAKLSALGLKRADVLLVGGIHDDALASSLVTSGVAHPGVVVRDTDDDKTLLSALLRQPVADVPVEVSGASWWWPRRVPSLLPGEHVTVLANLKGDAIPDVRVGSSKAVRPQPLEVAEPLLRRAWARAKLSELEARLATMDEKDIAQRSSLEAELTSISIRHRVLSSRTALLVLETERDYETYGISRLGLSDILTVGANGIQVIEGSKRASGIAAFTAKGGEPKRDEPTRDEPERKEMERGPTDEASNRMQAAPSSPAQDQEDREDDAQFEMANLGEEAAPAEAPRAEPAAPAPAPARAMPAPGDGFGALAGSRGRASAGVGGGGARDEAAAFFDGRPSPRRERRSPPQASRVPLQPVEQDNPPKLTLDSALEGPLLSVLEQIRAGNLQAALSEAWRFRAEDPASALALVALGHALRANGEQDEAARAYGSIIDLFPSRADLRRTAGNFLEQLTGTAALALAIDSYQKAREQRPDHPNSHRLYAWALIKAARYPEAFQALREGFARSYPENRFAGAKEILSEDLAIVASAWKKADKGAAERIDADMKTLELAADQTPTLRFILSWETDANDVDFHIYDGKHGHAYYERRALPSGGTLLTDVTNGYGPERFRIESPKAFPYQLVAHYYSRGPMGFGMGKVQVAYHDGQGTLTFEERPFVIMKDQASIDLGVIRGDEALFPKTLAAAKRP